jgi:hypothetical protein
MIETAVAQLQCELPLQRLSIIDDCLRFDRQLPPIASDNGIPGAKIADDRERNFGPEGEGLVQALPKTFEKPCVARVTNRIASWIGPDHQVQANDACDARDGVERRRNNRATLDSIHLGVREPARPADVLRAQSRGPSRRSQLPAEAQARRRRSASRAVSLGLSDRHRLPVSAATLIRPLAEGFPPSERYVDRVPRWRSSTDASPARRAIHRRRALPVDDSHAGRAAR